MTILAQHGFGKANKIDQGISNGSIQGVIMSPRDETPANLASFLSNLQLLAPSSVRLVDPLFHIGAVAASRDGKLRDYAHYHPNLTPTSFSPIQTQAFVTEVLNWQSNLDVSAVVSPTVIVDDLGSQWAQIALSLAQETINQHFQEKPLVVSLVVTEEALRNRPLVNAWLDELTTLDVDGFYLVVRRTHEPYRQHYEPDVLSALLHVCYSLAEINQYRLFVGYTDMVTLLLHAVGVTATASGWSLGLRQFSLRRFQPVDGGRPSRARYSSRPLLNSVFITHLDTIHSRGQISSILSNTPFDGKFQGTTNPANIPWPREESALQHWCVLSDIARATAANNVTTRLDLAAQAMGAAQNAYAQVSTFVLFSTETGPSHLNDWLDALSRFRSESGV